MPDSVFIQVKELTKRYRNSKTPALNSINMEIKKGEIFGLLGPNGAGKTTTISILSGIISPSSGHVYVAGMDMKKEKVRIKTKIGVAPQEIALYARLTVKENLQFFGMLYGLRGKGLKKRINDSLEMAGLTHAANKKISQCSGGMKRRANILAAILHSPEILFLDEPTTGIDVQSKNLLLDHIVRLNREGTTIIYSSHDMDEAQRLCSRIAILDFGRVILQGNPEDIIKEEPRAKNLEDLFLIKTGRSVRD